MFLALTMKSHSKGITECFYISPTDTAHFDVAVFIRPSNKNT